MQVIRGALSDAPSRSATPLPALIHSLQRSQGSSNRRALLVLVAAVSLVTIGRTCARVRHAEPPQSRRKLRSQRARWLSEAPKGESAVIESSANAAADAEDGKEADGPDGEADSLAMGGPGTENGADILDHVKGQAAAECEAVGPCLACGAEEVDTEYCKETGRREEVTACRDENETGVPCRASHWAHEILARA